MVAFIDEHRVLFATLAWVHEPASLGGPSSGETWHGYAACGRDQAPARQQTGCQHRGSGPGEEHSPRGGRMGQHPVSSPFNSRPLLWPIGWVPSVEYQKASYPTIIRLPSMRRPDSDNRVSGEAGAIQSDTDLCLSRERFGEANERPLRIQSDGQP
jgi:hypothetical protein